MQMIVVRKSYEIWRKYFRVVKYLNTSYNIYDRRYFSCVDAIDQ